MDASTQLAFISRPSRLLYLLSPYSSSVRFLFLQISCTQSPKSHTASMPDTRDTTVFPAARQWLATTLFLVMSAIAAYYMHGSHPATRTVGTSLAKLSESTTFVFPDSTIELRRTYTGLAPVDAGLSFLVAAFMTGVRGLNDAFRLQQIHFLFSFLPVLTVWSVESARKGSAWAAISLWVSLERIARVLLTPGC